MGLVERYSNILRGDIFGGVTSISACVFKRNARLSSTLYFANNPCACISITPDIRKLFLHGPYVSPTWAGKFLDGWCRKARRSRLKPLKKVAASLAKHRPVLLNYFRAKKAISGGVIEGLNNKVKVTFRKSYGFRTDKAREVALYHVLGKLPEPEVTHGFF